MTMRDDEDERLTLRLRSIPIPDPSPDFLAGARRRYLAAMEARYRREAVTGVVAACLGFVLVAALLFAAFSPSTLIVRVVVTIASVAKLMDGTAIVVSLVPAQLWIAAVAVSITTLLSIVPLRRVPARAVMK